MALEVSTLTKCGVPEDIARRELPHMERAMRKYGITTRPRARAFLATVLHESGGLRSTTEQASGAKYEGSRILGNTQRGDGQRFKGRGPIQLTGRFNYTSYGRQLRLDLVGHPDLVAKREIGWEVAGLFFKKCLPAADEGDFRRVTKLVNGGMNGWDDRLRYWKRLSALGVVPGSSDIKRGAKGPEVQTLTRRLSYLVSKTTHKPYLDGARSVFDRKTTRALRRFQKERGLKVDGVFGPRAAAELDRQVRMEKKRRHRADAKPAAAIQTMPPGATQAPAAVPAAALATPVTTPAPGATAVPKAPAKRPRGDRVDRLWRRLERLDELSDKLREQLVGLGAAGDGAAPAAALPPADTPAPVTPAVQLSTPELIESLRRVEADQGRVLGALETRLRSLDQPPAQTPAPAPAPPPAVPVGTVGAVAVADTVAVANGAPATTPAAGDESAAHIRELERLEAESDRLRAALEDRVLDAEGRAAHGLPADGPGVPMVENATTQRFIALVGELDAVDIKADRVRHALRIATSRGGARANGAHAAGTTAAVATAAGDTAPAARGARTFRLRAKPMKGSDVRNWQVQLNNQLKKLKVDHEIGVDGEYGGETARWSKRVLYALGLTSGKWEGVTPELRIKTRRPQRRTPAEVAAARGRVPWLRKLRKRYDAPKGGIRGSIAYAKKHVGTRETRPNGGGLIDEWERSVGIANAPWCGAFANYCLMQGGQPARSWLRYTPWIVENSKRGVGGFSWHQKPQIGDLVLFDWPGHDWVDHVGLVIETHPDGTVTTIEGNTGPSTDRVVRQQRRTCILGYARPPWKSGRR